MIEEIPGLLVDRDVQLGGEGADQRARQAGVGRGTAVGAARTHHQRVVGIGAEAIERQHVDDALLARDQRVHAEQRLGGMAQLLQPVVQREIEIGEGLEVVPQDRPQPGAILPRQARREIDRLAPEIGAQLGGHAGEEGVEILDQVEHVVRLEIADRRRLGLGAQLRQALAIAAPSGRTNSAFW